jgi:hypothetical protein
LDKKDRVVFTLHMPRHLHREVMELAALRHTSANAQLLQAVEAWLREARELQKGQRSA